MERGPLANELRVYLRHFFQNDGRFVGLIQRYGRRVISTVDRTYGTNQHSINLKIDFLSTVKVYF